MISLRQELEFILRLRRNEQISCNKWKEKNCDAASGASDSLPIYKALYPHKANMPMTGTIRVPIDILKPFAGVAALLVGLVV